MEFFSLKLNISSANDTLVAKSEDKKSFNLFFAIFIPILCFLITIGNLGTIIAFWKLPSLRDKPSELLILSLSCADFITGFHCHTIIITSFNDSRVLASKRVLLPNLDFLLRSSSSCKSIQSKHDQH